ncbi:M protein [Streptococcus dysgalactiae subsp. equisimilis]|nr:M protein [Streptococcus dysgalactiae subsp. equisimilis]
MARKNTNKQFSLRKLKTGTASVAVALTVVGAGLVAGQTVKANEEVTGRLVTNMWKTQYVKEKQRADELEKLLHSEVADYNSLVDKMKVVNDSLQTTKRDYEEIEKELGNKLKENQDLEEKLKNKEFSLGEALRYINELDLKLGQLNIDNIDLKHELEQEKQKAEAYRQTLEAEKAKLEEEKQISDASRQSLRRDLDASREAKKQLEAE